MFENSEFVQGAGSACLGRVLTYAGLAFDSGFKQSGFLRIALDLRGGMLLPA